MRKDMNGTQRVTMAIMTVIVAVTVIPRFAKYSQNLAIIGVCASIMMILECLLSQEMYKFSETIIMILLIPNIMMLFGELYPKFYEIDYIIVYFYATLNVVFTYIIKKNKAVSNFYKKIDTLKEKL